jgi:aminoglycoside phosphotransferase (APT) family kinase protein
MMKNYLEPSQLKTNLSIDLDIVSEFMDANNLGSGPILNIEQLSGGTQNILIKFERDSKAYVLRRPPVYLRAASNEVLRREAKILASLKNTEVPHPKFIAACLDESLMGAVFYLMEPIDGFNPGMGLPQYHMSDPKIRREMSVEAVSAIAKLGTVDYKTVGLEDFGSPDNFIDRQTVRWMSELESYSKLENYPGPEIPGLEKVTNWLSDNKPKFSQIGIMHGDYHLANLLYDFKSPKLLAAVDWEMSTIGDPLLDLGWLIATWPTEDGIKVGPSMALMNIGGFCTSDELIKIYESLSEFDLSYINWYVTMACYKLGIILEGTYARSKANKANKQVGQLLHAITLELFRKALEYC